MEFVDEPIGCLPVYCQSSLSVSTDISVSAESASPLPIRKHSIKFLSLRAVWRRQLHYSRADTWSSPSISRSISAALQREVNMFDEPANKQLKIKHTVTANGYQNIDHSSYSSLQFGIFKTQGMDSL